MILSWHNQSNREFGQVLGWLVADITVVRIFWKSTPIWTKHSVNTPLNLELIILRSAINRGNISAKK